MRTAILAAAAVAAIALAPAPAVAQGSFHTIAKLCPDLTLGQVENQLTQIFVDYELSNDDQVAAYQAAAVMGCIEAPADAQQAENDDETGVIPVVVAPQPQHYRRPSSPPRSWGHNPQRPWFEMPKPRKHARSRPRPRHAHPQHPPVRRLGPPLVAGAAASAPPLQPYKTEQGEPVCLPIAKPYPWCELVDTPGRNCANKSWRCKRSVGG
jgi:hypothetical protein